MQVVNVHVRIYLLGVSVVTAKKVIISAKQKRNAKVRIQALVKIS